MLAPIIEADAMKRPALATFFGLTAMLSFGCGDDTAGGSGSGGGSSQTRPFDGECRTARVPFPYLDDEGAPQITEIQIGGEESNDNFANRGDIIVEFTGEDGAIEIEMCPFTMASTEAAAQEAFDKLSLWAFNENVSSPQRPQDMNPEANCLEGGWKQSCGIRVYYDGMSQLSRAGADLRVTLPASYRHDVDIVTEDTLDDAYNRRGDVCVNNVNGNVSVDLESGEAYVIVSDETTEVPTCSAENIATCESNNWSIEPNACPCGNPIPFGLIEVSNEGTAAANITVDMPTDIWTFVRAENEGMQTESGDDPFFCNADVELPNFEVSEEIGERRDPWIIRGTANYPGMPATVGSGFQLQLVSANCAPVEFSDTPMDFADDPEAMEMTEKRGNILVANNVIRGQSCDQLIGAN